MRDPRVSPQPYDKVRSTKGKERMVVYVTIMDQVIYEPPKGPQRVCDLETWRRWAKNGAVLQRAEDVDHDSYDGLVVAQDYWLRGQITLIANRIMDSANRDRSDDRRVGSTPSREAAQVIFEAGLAAYWKDYRFRRLVDEETEKRSLR